VSVKIVEVLGRRGRDAAAQERRQLLQKLAARELTDRETKRLWSVSGRQLDYLSFGPTDWRAELRKWDGWLAAFFAYVLASPTWGTWWALPVEAAVAVLALVRLNKWKSPAALVDRRDAKGFGVLLGYVAARLLLGPAWELPVEAAVAVLVLARLNKWRDKDEMATDYYGYNSSRKIREWYRANKGLRFWVQSLWPGRGHRRVAAATGEFGSAVSELLRLLGDPRAGATLSGLTESERGRLAERLVEAIAGELTVTVLDDLEKWLVEPGDETVRAAREAEREAATARAEQHRADVAVIVALLDAVLTAERAQRVGIRQRRAGDVEAELRVQFLEAVLHGLRKAPAVLQLLEQAGYDGTAAGQAVLDRADERNKARASQLALRQKLLIAVVRFRKGNVDPQLMTALMLVYFAQARESQRTIDPEPLNVAVRILTERVHSLTDRLRHEGLPAPDRARLAAARSGSGRPR